MPFTNSSAVLRAMSHFTREGEGSSWQLKSSLVDWRLFWLMLARFELRFVQPGFCVQKGRARVFWIWATGDPNTKGVEGSVIEHQEYRM